MKRSDYRQGGLFDVNVTLNTPRKYDVLPCRCDRKHADRKVTTWVNAYPHLSESENPHYHNRNDAELEAQLWRDESNPALNHD